MTKLYEMTDYDTTDMIIGPDMELVRCSMYFGNPVHAERAPTGSTWVWFGNHAKARIAALHAFCSNPAEVLRSVNIAARPTNVADKQGDES